VLRNAGLEFVVAPIPTGRGETLRRIGPRHTIALFPFVDGETGEYGRYLPGARGAVLTMLAELHDATSAVGSVARGVGLEVTGRPRLEASLRELDQAWSGGPFSEPARERFAGHAADVTLFLSLADRLAVDVEQRGARWVVTHGEPHSANVMRAGTRDLLVDWDTVALAPRERDLWMLVENGADDLAAYAEATGHRIDHAALDFYRLAWDLNDVAESLNVLRSPHGESEDTAWAYDALTTCMPSRDQWSRLLAR
jgi:spectinomycin phosphotransferase